MHKDKAEQIVKQYGDEVFQVYEDFLTRAKKNNKRWVIHTNTLGKDVRQIELYKMGLVSQNSDQIKIIVTIPKQFNKDSFITISTDRISEHTEIEGLEVLYNIINAK